MHVTRLVFAWLFFGFTFSALAADGTDSFDHITSIVVGCRPHDHAVHFFGGHWVNCNFLREPVIHIEKVESLYEEEGCHWRYSRTTTPNERAPKIQFDGSGLTFTFNDGKKISSYGDAVRYAHDLELRPLKMSIWETLPEETLYIDGGFSYPKIDKVKSKFEDSVDGLTKARFPNLRKIIVEFYSERTLADYIKIMQLASQLLQEGGVLLFEVHSNNYPINKPTKEELKDAVREILSDSDLFDRPFGSIKFKPKLGLERNVPIANAMLMQDFSDRSKFRDFYSLPEPLVKYRWERSTDALLSGLVKDSVAKDFSEKFEIEEMINSRRGSGCVDLGLKFTKR